MKKRIPWETEAGMGNDRRSHIHRMHGGQEAAAANLGISDIKAAIADQRKYSEMAMRGYE